MGVDFDNSVENPLILPLLGMLQTSEQSYKVHQLATELRVDGVLPELDDDPNKSLFKRNFLIMNALYQLQESLLPDCWLQVQSLNIQLFAQTPSNYVLMQEQDSGLRSYYLDWSNYDTSVNEIETLVNHFWSRYQKSFDQGSGSLDRCQALQLFNLSHDASKQDIRRQWRKLALKWHPDRESGDANRFREICEAWQVLRVEKSL